MLHKKTLSAFSGILGLMIVGVTFTEMSPPRNLKVLPKDISDAKLDSIMHTYNTALGVKCNFCHVPVAPNFPDSLDYASDKDPMKEEARKMMRMTIDINKNNFYFDKAIRPEYLKVVTCKTCHRAEAFPPED